MEEWPNWELADNHFIGYTPYYSSVNHKKTSEPENDNNNSDKIK